MFDILQFVICILRKHGFNHDNDDDDDAIKYEIALKLKPGRPVLLCMAVENLHLNN